MDAPKFEGGAKPWALSVARLRGPFSIAGLSCALVAIGLLLRFRQLLDFPSLWMDEAMLAVNVVERSFGALLQPLEYNQGAPLGFLFVQKAATWLFGASDVSLRIFPLLASGLALILFARLAMRWLGAAGLVAVALMAVSPTLLDYSVEAKQYSSDVLGAVVMWSVVRPWLDGVVPGRRDFVRLALAGAACLTVSHPVVFVLPGVALVVAGRFAKAMRREELVTALSVFALWAAVMLALYAISLKSLSANAQLLDYWKAYFLPLRLPDALRWLAWALQRGMSEAAGLGPFLVAAPLAVTGALHLARRQPRVATVVFLPLVFALAASALGLYPFAQRLILFLAPAVYLAVAGGVDAIARLAGRAAPVLRAPVAAALGMAVLALPAWTAAKLTAQPAHGENLRPGLEFLVARRIPGDAVYVYYGAKPALRFYAGSLGIDAKDTTLGRAHRGMPTAYLDEVAALRSSDRVWFVYSHACPNCETDEQKYILGALAAYGDRVETVESEGTGVYLFDFGARR